MPPDEMSAPKGILVKANSKMTIMESTSVGILKMALNNRQHLPP